MSEEWVEATLGEVALINPDKTPKWDVNKAIRYVDIASVSKEAGIDLESLSEIPFGEAPGRARRMIRSGDVLVSTVRPNLRAFAQVPEELDGEVASTGFAVLRGSDRVLSGYLWAISQTDAFVGAMVSKCTGTNYPAIRPADIATYIISLPPLPVQRRIVDLMTHLDAHIADLQAERAALSSVLRNYRLVTFTRITGEWPTVKLGDTVESLDSMRRPVKSADRVSGPYPYYGASGVVDFVNDWIFEGQTLLVSEDGANLRARSSPIAFCANGRYWVNNHAHVLRALDTTTNDYLAHYLECTDIDLALTGTTMPKLNAANLLRIEVPLPPLSMQRDLTESLERLSASITASQCESQRLEELRTALLEGLLVGSVEIPSDYDSLSLNEVA